MTKASHSPLLFTFNVQRVECGAVFLITTSQDFDSFASHSKQVALPSSFIINYTVFVWVEIQFCSGLENAGLGESN